MVAEPSDNHSAPVLFPDQCPGGGRSTVYAGTAYAAVHADGRTAFPVACDQCAVVFPLRAPVRTAVAPLHAGAAKHALCAVAPDVFAKSCRNPVLPRFQSACDEP